MWGTLPGPVTISSWMISGTIISGLELIPANLYRLHTARREKPEEPEYHEESLRHETVMVTCIPNNMVTHRDNDRGKTRTSNVMAIFPPSNKQEHQDWRQGGQQAIIQRYLSLLNMKTTKIGFTKRISSDPAGVPYNVFCPVLDGTRKKARSVRRNVFSFLSNLLCFCQGWSVSMIFQTVFGICVA